VYHRLGFFDGDRWACGCSALGRENRDIQTDILMIHLFGNTKLTQHETTRHGQTFGSTMENQTTSCTSAITRTIHHPPFQGFQKMLASTALWLSAPHSSPGRLDTLNYGTICYATASCEDRGELGATSTDVAGWKRGMTILRETWLSYRPSDGR